LIYIKVINNNIEKALRKLKKEVKETKLLLELKQNEYYRKPSEIRRERKAKAKIRQKKFIENWVFFMNLYIYIYIKIHHDQLGQHVM